MRSLYENTFKADHGDGSGATPQYIDGAAWVGEAWALRLFAEAVGKQGWMTRNGGTSDRAAWIEWAVENERMVAVDRAQELAMTIRGGLSNHCTVSRTEVGVINSCTGKPTCGVRVMGNSIDSTRRELESTLSKLKTATRTDHSEL